MIWKLGSGKHCNQTFSILLGTICFKILDRAQYLECAEFLIVLKCVCKENKLCFQYYISVDVSIKN